MKRWRSTTAISPSQPNIDESVWLVNGRLPGFAGRIVIDALEAKADTFPTEPRTRCLGLRGMRMLCGRSASMPSTVATVLRSKTRHRVLTVFVDANEAASTNGQAGVTVAGGPRVGEAAIEAILCDGIIEVTARTKDGTPLRMGRRSRADPAADAPLRHGS